MSRTYVNIKTGEEFSANSDGGIFLSKITFGLFETIGCYPKTVEDCKLVARILKNRIRLNKWYSDYWEELFGVEKETPKGIKWMKEGCKFFNNIEDIKDLKFM